MSGPEVAAAIDPERGLPLTELNHDQLQPALGHEITSEYRNREVTEKLTHRPWLKILDEFLDPHADNFGKVQKRRLLHFDVVVIHILPNGQISVPNSYKGEDGWRQFEEAINPGDTEGCGTIILTEDSSLAMIDALGLKYDIEPEFFACHLEGTDAFRTDTGSWLSPTVRSPTRAPNVLGDYLRKAPFYTAEFRRPSHFKDGHKEIQSQRSQETCTPRGAQILNKTIPDVFIFEKISVYEKKSAKSAIILTDALLSRNPPASYMHDAITSSDNTSYLPASGRTRQVSAREELIAHLRSLPPRDALALFSDDNHEPLLLKPVLKIVERMSATFLQHARWIMSRIVTQHCDREFPDSIPFFLTISRALYRHIHDQKKLLAKAMRIATLRGGGSRGLKEQMEDFTHLNEDMDAALKALEEDVRFIVAVASIKEGRVVGWVTKLAFYFLPLSLWATILAIFDNFRFYIFGALSLPSIVAATYLLFYFKPSNMDSLKFDGK